MSAEIERIDQGIAAAVRAEMARQMRRQEGLAAELGIAQQGISRRLRGDMPWRAAELVAVARWLDVPLTRLLGDVLSAAA
jgi:transcriptional regulator with XRE-family HTH domain